MTCIQCAKSVKTALKKIKGYKNVDVSFDDHTAMIMTKMNVSNETIIETIESIGYSVVKKI